MLCIINIDFINFPVWTGVDQTKDSFSTLCHIVLQMFVVSSDIFLCGVLFQAMYCNTTFQNILTHIFSLPLYTLQRRSFWCRFFRRPYCGKLGCSGWGWWRPCWRRRRCRRSDTVTPSPHTGMGLCRNNSSLWRHLSKTCRWKYFTWISRHLSRNCLSELINSLQYYELTRRCSHLLFT